ncbi:N(5)-(carboxyethyl)ornithine synthase [Liquorilactobacillus mali]|uniref:N(5)-(Carboxyethyl)ornithine synthase n=1 Tax=Liquorilactobacillus mali KCTC 3596 = DSM 20444 TaxID=1046596 RepID=A0A0R2E538_9LACO|nr:N(5)-(carboxyethyl)ornithine synthase [Liquorilactobacillus mali]KRN08023.1 N(5)-(carboxyethyl)ornithine synthase [Liquorilactobacillus mali KCTC 3596 = DSM 20444]
MGEKIMIIKSVGFPLSTKENEKRIVLIPRDIRKMKYPQELYFEKGYGYNFGISDDEYRNLGCHIASRDDILKQAIVCGVKIGEEKYIQNLSSGQTIFGWIHAMQDNDVTKNILKLNLRIFAWEKMFDQGRHVFWKNNILAGEAAVIHAFQCYGRLPRETKVAVIGRGNTARGALRALDSLNAEAVQYNRRTVNILKSNLADFDVIVNCVLWDSDEQDHIIYKTDLKRMKKGALIIDVSCDRNGAIETSVPTTIEHPTYKVDGILHYVVDHTPSIFFKTFTLDNSEVIFPYIEQLMTGNIGNVLKGALIKSNDKVTDK